MSSPHPSTSSYPTYCLTILFFPVCAFVSSLTQPIFCPFCTCIHSSHPSLLTCALFSISWQVPSCFSMAALICLASYSSCLRVISVCRENCCNRKQDQQTSGLAKCFIFNNAERISAYCQLWYFGSIYTSLYSISTHGIMLNDK